MPNYVNQREFRVVGMSRSGNHAVINWILSQSKGRYCFLNATQANYNPFLTTQPLDGSAPDCQTRALANYKGFQLYQEQAGDFSPKDLLIYSHEDEFLGRVGNPNFERHHDAFVGPSRFRLDVLILRDPFNLFASRLRARYGWVSPQVAMRIWKQHAKEFLRRSEHLKYGPMLISYNLWSQSRDYRRGIASGLGLRFTDEGAESVSNCGGGSSFDGIRYDGKASKMKVLQRWRSYQEDPLFIGLFDDEVFELSESIFGHIPGTETLRKRAHQMQRAG